MTPEQAVAAAVVIGARLVVPIHYGVTGAEGYRELPNCESILLNEARRRNVDVEVARPGEWLAWHARNSALMAWARHISWLTHCLRLVALFYDS
jgi:L-ascorbate metabolism protein UlaG (beta-lactamase superfamily)